MGMILGPLFIVLFSVGAISMYGILFFIHKKKALKAKPVAFIVGLMVMAFLIYLFLDPALTAVLGRFMEGGDTQTGLFRGVLLGAGVVFIYYVILRSMSALVRYINHDQWVNAVVILAMLGEIFFFYMLVRKPNLSYDDATWITIKGIVTPGYTAQASLTYYHNGEACRNYVPSKSSSLSRKSLDFAAELTDTWHYKMDVAGVVYFDDCRYVAKKIFFDLKSSDLKQKSCYEEQKIPQKYVYKASDISVGGFNLQNDTNKKRKKDAIKPLTYFVERFSWRIEYRDFLSQNSRSEGINVERYGHYFDFYELIESKKLEVDFIVSKKIKMNFTQRDAMSVGYVVSQETIDASKSDESNTTRVQALKKLYEKSCK